MEQRPGTVQDNRVSHLTTRARECAPKGILWEVRGLNDNGQTFAGIEASCTFCSYHTFYSDELSDGSYESDGCTCDHQEGDEHYHVNNCTEYVREKFEGCPYYSASK